ncbi:hypothetical protein Taro_027836 [Colocasia esculenta]|uniref:Uncharacterized protein n=1 Tax=Colocasia esculenta TaxID=4460 RepID=A0A843VNM7_COLES|nr:hypothetical protein [Colocasia esculenta]
MVVLCPAADAHGGGRGGAGMGGRRSSASSSPEFEFWMVHNPSLPQPDLLSADELFVDGVILPLRLRHQPASDTPHPRFGPEPQPERVPQPQTEPQPEREAEAEGEPGPQPPVASITAAEPAPPASSSSPSCTAPSSSAHLPSSAAPAPSTSKRWKDLFKVAGGEKRAEDKERRRERKNSAGGGAELNINIWPFSRSRSAGNSGTRPKSAAASGRRVSSAPCSRSNSRGESSRAQAAAVATATAAVAVASNGTRRWASSPGRAGLAAGGGIHVGRASPVWQARRAGKKCHNKGGDSIAGMPSGGKGRKEVWGGSGMVGVNLNVNTCIGYGQQLSCRADDKDALGGGSGSRAASATSSNNGNGSHFISLKAFFFKKVY